MSKITSERTIKLGFFGEAMLEISGQPLQKRYGGDVLNTAIYLSRLSRKYKLTDIQLDLRFITAMGKDPVSDSLITAWQNEGINTGLVVKLADKKPVLYPVDITPDGERKFHY